MKKYLSFGGGVNSTAMLLHLIDEGATDFEAIYVDHGGDWPETRAWVRRVDKEIWPIKILTPMVQGHSTLYDYCWTYEMCPGIRMRFCTAKFKVRVIEKYVEKPCFQLLGIDAGEAHRAKLRAFKDSENRFPLIEAGIDRHECKNIIEAHGFPIPRKSGCFFCPFQRVRDWKTLRRIHPDLFCKAEALEKRNLAYRAREGLRSYYLSTGSGKPLGELVRLKDEDTMMLFEELKYPPCNCGL